MRKLSSQSKCSVIILFSFFVITCNSKSTETNYKKSQSNNISIKNYCLLFDDGTQTCIDYESINSSEIDSINFTYKNFNASIENSCYKGDSFFLDDNITKFLDQNLKKLVSDSYKKTNTSPTAFNFIQNKNKISLNVINKNDVEKYCHSKNNTDIKARAILLKIFIKDKVFNKIIVKDIEL
ncbi:hypothetical protein LUD75_18880 [Epilithonimonas sp. JDS]|uniref:hypothetical protein n=1 Tax=Epilithonimonas sp. JDS TaxID=2902797 RepID=UPI001E63CDA5|nr:hypothetical protein [Epilithonimonas sp. JDS]MCD9856796.1 hypothetical protein [Epilithonimonas sp. JDS]